MHRWRGCRKPLTTARSGRTLSGSGVAVYFPAMGILKFLGVAILLLWLVLWLAVKITFGAIHLLVLLGIAMIVIGFVKSAGR